MARWLGDGDIRPKKFGRQSICKRQGLPVPEGLVLGATELDDTETLHAIRQFVRAGPVVARGATEGEDGETRSFAGLSRTLPGLCEPDAVVQVLHDLLEPEGPEPAMEAVLVQRQVERRWLLVVARERVGPWLVEAHDGHSPPDALAVGASPHYVGLLEEWSETELRSGIEGLAQRAWNLFPSPHGIDLEIVVDPSGQAWLVQARPLASPLVPGWPAFLAAASPAMGEEASVGRLVLDAEHNPAPLSPAHAWLMRRLAALRPETSGDPVVLAGWLYVRTRTRDLENPSPRAPARPARDVLTWLLRTELPAARARLQLLGRELAEGLELAEAFERAEALFFDMIDAYTGVLVPARRRAIRHVGLDRLQAHQSRFKGALTLSGRHEYLDVLPVAWDLCSPSLLDSDPGLPSEEPLELPSLDEVGIALALGEQDDHLFALGLAGLRRCWLEGARRASVSEALAFMLEPVELVRLVSAVSRGGDRDESERLLEMAQGRERILAKQATLSPPRSIVDGRPVPTPRAGRMGGFPIGPVFVGPVAVRLDLDALLRRPPAPGSILCIPALTAQAAVALSKLGVRAVCSEYGGGLSHGALMARELGLSALIGCRGCTTITEGCEAVLDTRVARLLPRPPAVR